MSGLHQAGAVRRGSVLPLAIILLFASAGIGALVIDYCFLSIAAAELKQAAEGAALAGARVVADVTCPNEPTDLFELRRAVLRQARNVGANNLVAGRPACLPDDAASDGAADLEIIVGELLRTEQGETAIWEESRHPDTVQVIIRRTRGVGRPVPVLMRIPGSPNAVDVRATAQATLESRVAGVRATRDLNVPAVPFAILGDCSDGVESWHSSITLRQGGDEYSYDSARRVVVNRGDGIPEIRVVMAGDGDSAPGNLVATRLQSGRSLPQELRQVRNGWNQDDLATYGGTLAASPGEPSVVRIAESFEAIEELPALTGTVRIWPLYSSAGTERPNEVYLVRLVAARLMDVRRLNDGRLESTLQPTLLISPTAVIRRDVSEANPYIRKLRISG